MATRKFNPKRITGSFKGVVGGREFAVQFQGFMDGTFISAEFNEDQVTTHVGSQGDVSIVLNSNRTATVTFTLAQGSPTNGSLSNLVPDADIDFAPVGVLTFQDLNGTTKFKGAESWIQKTAPVEYSNEITGRAWIFGVARAEIFVGGGESL